MKIFRKSVVSSALETKGLLNETNHGAPQMNCINRADNFKSQNTANIKCFIDNISVNQVAKTVSSTAIMFNNPVLLFYFPILPHVCRVHPFSLYSHLSTAIKTMFVALLTDIMEEASINRLTEHVWLLKWSFMVFIASPQTLKCLYVLNYGSRK